MLELDGVSHARHVVTSCGLSGVLMPPVRTGLCFTALHSPQLLSPGPWGAAHTYAYQGKAVAPETSTSILSSPEE